MIVKGSLSRRRRKKERMKNSSYPTCWNRYFNVVRFLSLLYWYSSSLNINLISKFCYLLSMNHLQNLLNIMYLNSSISHFIYPFSKLNSKKIPYQNSSEFSNLIKEFFWTKKHTTNAQRNFEGFYKRGGN